MRKFTKASLTLLLALSMSLSVSAASTTIEEASSTTIGVNGEYTPISGGDDKISVNLSYDDLTFTYSEGSKGTWNPQTHVYDGVMPPHWEDKSVDITVTNNSNVAINADFTFAGVESNHNANKDNKVIRGIFSLPTVTLPSADCEEYRNSQNAPSDVTNFRIDPSSPGINEEQKIGDITVNISKINTPFIATVTGETNLETLKSNITTALNNGTKDLVLTLPESTSDDIFTAIREGINESTAEEGSINMTLKTVKTINGGAFFMCRKLGSVSLPDAETLNMNDKNTASFHNCDKIKKVSAPKAETLNASFSNCESLIEISLPSAKNLFATFVGSGIQTAYLPMAEDITTAFGTSQIKNAYLPNVTSTRSAFNDSKITEVHLPKVTEISAGTFNKCYNLKKIQFDSIITSIGAEWILIEDNMDENETLGVTLILNAKQAEQEGDFKADFEKNTFGGFKFEDIMTIEEAEAAKNAT